MLQESVIHQWTDGTRKRLSLDRLGFRKEARPRVMKMLPADLLVPAFSGLLVLLRCGFQTLHCRFAAAVVAADDRPSPNTAKVVSHYHHRHHIPPFSSSFLTGLNTVQSNT